MSEPGVEEIQGWAQDLTEIEDLIGKRFARSEARTRAVTYLRMLLSPIERKNGWQLAEEAGDRTPYAMQHLVGRAVWSADEVRDDLRDYVKKHFDGGVLVVDETGFLKKGTKSAGVGRQYSGTAGRIENCQIGVFLGYASPRGRMLVDRELYLPKAWAEDAERRVEAGIPTDVEFATKPVLARRMIERARHGGLVFNWVTGATVYGMDGALRAWLERTGIFYVLGVTSQYQVFFQGERQWVSEIAAALTEWKILSAGRGSKGERRYHWAILQDNPRWLLFRRSLTDPTDLAYYVVSGTHDTTLEEIVRVAGTRWTIEECFEIAKGEVGLDHYEVRSWSGWYRHITLAMLAQAYLAVVRAEAVKKTASRRRKGFYPTRSRKFDA